MLGSCTAYKNQKSECSEKQFERELLVFNYVYIDGCYCNKWLGM